MGLTILVIATVVVIVIFKVTQEAITENRLSKSKQQPNRGPATPPHANDDIASRAARECREMTADLDLGLWAGSLARAGGNAKQAREHYVQARIMERRTGIAQDGRQHPPPGGAQSNSKVLHAQGGIPLRCVETGAEWTVQPTKDGMLLSQIDGAAQRSVTVRDKSCRVAFANDGEDGRFSLVSPNSGRSSFCGDCTTIAELETHWLLVKADMET